MKIRLWKSSGGHNQLWPGNSQLGLFSPHSYSVKCMKCNPASVKDTVLLQRPRLSAGQPRVYRLFILFSMKDAGVLSPILQKFCVARERPLLITRQYSCKMSRFPISGLNKDGQLKGSRSWRGFKTPTGSSFTPFENSSGLQKGTRVEKLPC